jgi:hypothetical protein
VADITQIRDAVKQDEEGAVVTIFDKNDEPYLAADGTPCTMTVLGSESRRVRKAQLELAKRRTRPGRSTRFTLEEAEELQIEQSAAAVTAWHGFEDANGVELPCTPENVKTVLGLAQHILLQVQSAIQDHARFFAKPSES